ncbi:hypothetical protein [Pseudoxanthomonas sp. z9]|uniref:hypothetical protein n=1 Tax=Pseudoxanthomonas sp. z9 TaxID=2584942 RepID=UPI00114329CD|nr:hypothetical protein [Pseudoxanthomonas sp. z9]
MSMDGFSRKATESPQEKEGLYALRFIVPLSFAALVVVFFYRWRFGAYLAGDQNIWGSFGDYFGGLMNPMIGFITVILVLRTLQITRKESEDNRRELALQRLELGRQTEEAINQTRITEKQLAIALKNEELRDIQKCLDSVVFRIEELLKTPVRHGLHIGLQHGGNSVRVENTFTSRHEVLTERNIVSLISNAVEMNKRMGGKSGSYAMTRTQWITEFSPVISLTRELAYYCSIYVDLYGDSWVLQYYKRRTFPIAFTLSLLDLVPQPVLLALTPSTLPEEFRGEGED